MPYAFILLAKYMQWFVVVYLSSVDYKLYLRFDCLKILLPPPFLRSKNNPKYKILNYYFIQTICCAIILKVEGKEEVRIFRY